jgi:serine/threonine protein kinase
MFRRFNPFFAEDLTDAAFDQLGPLGEGARVDRVRYKQTGVTLARKIILISDMSNRQLARELIFAAISDHPNIVKLRGVYLSPSSMEVKILMEFCRRQESRSCGKANARARRDSWREDLRSCS